MSKDQTNLEAQESEEIIGSVDISDDILQSVAGGCTPSGCLFTKPDNSCNGGYPCPQKAN